jgi:tRNA threonylcarbamoyladenosine biosynthesis protein TsaB
MDGGPMTLLAIESATDMVGVALVGGVGGPVERVHLGGRLHAELLAPAIEEVCALAGCTIGEVTGVAVDVGPGLFTGLRVGVATAKALAQGLGCRVLAVSSLDILASAAVGQDDAEAPRLVVPVVDARRGEVFTAAYHFELLAEHAEVSDPASVREDRLEPMSPGDLVDWLLDLGSEVGSVTVVGDGAVRYRRLLSVHSSLDLRLAGELSAPPPLALARLATARLSHGGTETLAPEDLVPDYRRHADARINWEERAPRTAGATPTDPTRS